MITRFGCSVYALDLWKLDFQSFPKPIVGTRYGNTNPHWGKIFCIDTVLSPVLFQIYSIQYTKTFILRRLAPQNKSNENCLKPF